MRLSQAVSVIVAFFLAALAFAAPPPGEAATEVENLERELVAAIAQGDMAAYDRIVADDYVVFDASGKKISKAEVMASYRSGERRYTGLEIFDVEGRVFGDAAVVGARTKGFRREGDRDVPNRVRYIRIYSRRDGRWRAVSQMAAPVGESDPEKREKKNLSGNRGGDGAAMEVTAAGARLDFDCVDP